jgi:hypothetical protein
MVSVLPAVPANKLAGRLRAIHRHHRQLISGPSGNGLKWRGDRKFEFVQQTWLNSPSFHGLRDGPDPLVAWLSNDSRFTSPTISGPVRPDDMNNFVAVRAGGYFFLPICTGGRHTWKTNRPRNSEFLTCVNSPERTARREDSWPAQGGTGAAESPVLSF